MFFVNDKRSFQMNNNSRLEYRYFFKAGQEQRLRDYLDMFPGLSRISFPNPVTQTLYFTQGKSGKYAIPEKTIVRIRKYSESRASNSSSISFGEKNRSNDKRKSFCLCYQRKNISKLLHFSRSVFLQKHNSFTNRS